MLARRFIIVCLLATLFAMAMIAMIEAQSRPAYSLKIQNSMPCIYDTPLHCRLTATEEN